MTQKTRTIAIVNQTRGEEEHSDDRERKMHGMHPQAKGNTNV